MSDGVSDPLLWTVIGYPKQLANAIKNTPSCDSWQKIHSLKPLYFMTTFKMCNNVML